MDVSGLGGPFLVLPDPGRRDLDDLVERLRLLKVWAGDPSYETHHGPGQRGVDGGRAAGR